MGACCSLTMKSFSQSMTQMSRCYTYNLRNHSKTHEKTGKRIVLEKIFKCDNCEMAFETLYEKKLHEFNVCEISAILPRLKCYDCNQEFVKLYTLKEHMLTDIHLHNTNKELIVEPGIYYCHFCKKNFCS